MRLMVANESFFVRYGDSAFVRDLGTKPWIKRSKENWKRLELGICHMRRLCHCCEKAVDLYEFLEIINCSKAVLVQLGRGEEALDREEQFQK